jgi:threonine dehydratase
MVYRPDPPAIRDLEAAARRITGLTWRTPMVQSAWLSDLIGGEVWLKLETVQATGSFKIRGAANAVARLREVQRQVETVMTASAGNHGLALAAAAARHGLRARVYLPSTAPDAKRAALARLGAEIVSVPTYDAAEAAARAEGESEDTTFISPYDDVDVIAGAGTVAIEMIAEHPHLDAIVVPLGGGGLISGTAVAVEALSPATAVVGVEAAASPVFTAALGAGRPVIVEVLPTLADGLAGNMDSESRTFPFVRDLVKQVLRVGDVAIGSAMRELVFRERLVAEGAGAVGVAALLDAFGHPTATAPDAASPVEAPEADASRLLADRLRGRRVGVILSGRNVDRDVLTRLLAPA